MPKKGISTNGGQNQSTFAQGCHVPSVTFMAFFWIARYHYNLNVSSPKGRIENDSGLNTSYNSGAKLGGMGEASPVLF